MGMKVGDLIQFDYINAHCREINKKMGIFLGERPLKRADGTLIENFEIMLFGEDISRSLGYNLGRLGL